ncbi:uncharacterized protein L969DRAFT_88042 [Mixia osmundae IAM 14324]|uniref:Bacteriophage T5 Orf172 DNA-binding domain-containing protein n=1 Tax=Mixia osmundae (strain CBS 9802 / IAM 14324 / JCM 22182 / KY 12970) TaxID=764103 RepID=G7E189_MIXOS|nr:uncharacterized protein L969DRAFT_88042 [Mixia osmundae IAM 14324]KEI38762.1 hypothetical protein L969DRAFT_88042 [Mixia osmundae IAM 14324]GAA96599.1 hypothetical protein E5Q_03269 [Mixia osmundae IAM 14324]
MPMPSSRRSMGSPTRGSPAGPRPNPFATPSPGKHDQVKINLARDEYAYCPAQNSIPKQPLAPVPMNVPPHCYGQSSASVMANLPPLAHSLPHASPSRPQPKPVMHTPSKHEAPSASSSLTKGSSSTPTKATRPRASPSPGPSSKITLVQCSGITSAGKRCERKVKAGELSHTTASAPLQRALSSVTQASLQRVERRLTQRGKGSRAQTPSRGVRQLDKNEFEIVDSDEDEFDVSILHADSDEPVAVREEDRLPVFCHQHGKHLLEDEGMYLRDSNWQLFSDWIPDGLPEETKLQLRATMRAQVTSHDVPGSMYVYELAPKSHARSDTTFIKVGRTKDLARRLREWKRQCPSRSPIVRDFFPLHPDHPLAHLQTRKYGVSNEGMHASGALLARDPAPYNFRWERLCLIEMAGRVALDHIDRLGSDAAMSITDLPCRDCGKQHKELFEVSKGAYEAYVRELVMRWQRFVELI